MKIYISGPMTDRPDSNKKAFYAKERQLRELGYTSIKNPAVIENLAGPGQDYAVYFRAAIHFLLASEILVYIDDAHLLSSKGCYAETLLAEGLGMPLCFCKSDGLYKAVRDRTLLTCAYKTDNPLLF